MQEPEDVMGRVLEEVEKVRMRGTRSEVVECICGVEVTREDTEPVYIVSIRR